ncbi:MAG: hypothetical protein HFH65_03765 [Lachnospiraceae bacterium]|jgi:hypothetical protein|nr:hypothetical protein [Lachnospiraceae bacterium]MCI8824472.1 hypothetical protein [Lachnospiraceae bacterium]MCI9369435.1 hypothetical protein [Lachnospiraceae bacterium]
MSYLNQENNNENKENDIKISEVRHRTASSEKNIVKNAFGNNRRVILCIALVTIIVIMLIFSIVSNLNKAVKKSPDDGKNDTIAQTEETSSEENAEETSEEQPTEPQFTLKPETEDSEIARLVSAFYQAYLISGDINEVSNYIDSSSNFNVNKLSINKKYIETFSDIQCYKSDLDTVDKNYAVVIVTYKIKLYNYDEMLPSIDILFLVDGDAGYRVHNLTVADEFERQKVENDQNFQILAKNAAEELNALLAANSELNEVYNLYLHPETSAQGE